MPSFSKMSLRLLEVGLGFRGFGDVPEASGRRFGVSGFRRCP